MPDRTDQPGRRRFDRAPSVCVHCRAAIDPTRWHPVVTRAAESYRIYTFCDERCRDAWLAERA